jgi:hypothetical protein
MNMIRVRPGERVGNSSALSAPGVQTLDFGRPFFASLSMALATFFIFLSGLGSGFPIDFIPLVRAVVDSSCRFGGGGFMTKLTL